MQYIIYFIIFILTASCTSLEDAGKVLRNEKTKTTDEFLIEKKSPLVLPPKFDELPTPGTNLEKKAASSNEIQKLLEKNDIKKNSSQSLESNKIEENILEKIKNK